MPPFLAGGDGATTAPAAWPSVSSPWPSSQTVGYAAHMHQVCEILELDLYA